TPAKSFGPTATINRIAKINSGNERFADRTHLPNVPTNLFVTFLAAMKPSGTAKIEAINVPANAIKIVSIIIDATSPDAAQSGEKSFGIMFPKLFMTRSIARPQLISIPRNVHTYIPMTAKVISVYFIFLYSDFFGFGDNMFLFI